MYLVASLIPATTSDTVSRAMKHSLRRYTIGVRLTYFLAQYQLKFGATSKHEGEYRSKDRRTSEEQVRKLLSSLIV